MKVRNVVRYKASLAARSLIGEDIPHRHRGPGKDKVRTAEGKNMPWLSKSKSHNL